MTITISIGIMGFSVPEQKRLEQILALSHSQPRCYKLNDIAANAPIDVLIVKPTDASVLTQQQTYLAKHQDRSIIVLTAATSPNATQQAVSQFPNILIPSRVFAVLDALNVGIKSEVLQVLVIDDSVMMQKTIHLELQKASTPLAVDFAESGEVALEKVQQRKYDFIFLDVMMSGMDGFETCSRIRQLDGMSKTPIIMLTSKTSALDEVKGLMAGCTTYLTKPFVHEEFQTMLERVMYWVKEFNNGK